MDGEQGNGEGTCEMISYYSCTVSVDANLKVKLENEARGWRGRRRWQMEIEMETGQLVFRYSAFRPVACS